MESIIKGIVLIIALFLIYTPHLSSEQLNNQVESLKRQIEQIQIENQKMIEEIQQKSQQQIDDLKKKIEQMEADRQTDKEEVKELKADSKQTEGKLEEVINSKIEPLTGYFPKVKFNPDFPSYFRSRARLIENATFLGATPNTEDQIAFADSRLMISPMLEVNENISLRSQIDVARNIIWGGIGDENSADKVFVAPSPSDSFRGAVLRDVTDTFSGNTISAVDQDIDFFDIRTLYFMAKTPVGELWFGRQPYDWALGILANAGSLPDQDFGTIVDRFEFDTAPFTPLGGAWERLILVFTFDILSQGRTLSRGAEGNGWEGGLGALYFGDNFEFGGYAYLVNQEKFNVSNGLRADLDNPIVWSLYGKYDKDPFYLAFEFENIFGKLSDLDDPLPSVIGDSEIDITTENFLFVGRLGYNPPTNRVDRIVTEFGWSSGDDSATPDKLEGNAIFFNNAYVIDNLLFKHVIPNIYAVEGSVINSGYVKAHTTLNLSNSLYFTPQILFAWTDERNALLGTDGLTPLPAVNKYLGTELEGTLTWKIMDHLWFDLIGSYIFAGDGLDDLLSQRALLEGSISDLNESNPSSSIYSIQGRFIFTLDNIIKTWKGNSSLNQRAYFGL